MAQALRDSGTEVEVLAPGHELDAAPHLHLAAPLLPVGASDNDQSLWVRVQLGTARILMTGDAQELGVAAAADLWITGQHGTVTLSGEPMQLQGSTGGRPLAVRH